LKNCDAAFAIKVTKGCQDPTNITIKVVYTNCAVLSEVIQYHFGVYDVDGPFLYLEET